MTRRLIAVLGYSNGAETLHEVCAARLRRAEAEARPGDVVLLTGWSRRRGGRSEAELMAEEWRGRDVELLVGRDARTTFGNALDAARAAKEHDVEELVLVTSAWHLPRAAALFRAALRSRPIPLTAVAADGTPPSRTRIREVGCWLFAPPQALVLGRLRQIRRQ